MTMRRLPKQVRKIPAVYLIGMLAAGCAGLGLVSTPEGDIYVLDTNNHRVVRINNMTGLGWTAFGSGGSGVNQFRFPGFIHIDGSGRILVSDNTFPDGNNRIVRVDSMTGAGWITFGSTGTGVNQFIGPSGIFTDGSGRIYVADGSNNRLIRVDNITGAGWTAFGTEGAGVNQFRSPGAVIVR